MGASPRITAHLLVLVSIVAACSPTSAGPESPRPKASTTSTTITTTLPTTTVVIDETTRMATQCPSVFCLIYHIKPEASWSSGAPVTAADFVHTVEVQIDPQTGVPAPGYDLMTSVDVLDEKTVRIVFSEGYGPWHELFDRLLPAGHDGNSVAGLPTTGPFQFERWTPGDRIVLTRNPRWWSSVDPFSGEAAGRMSELEFVFITEFEEMVSALQEGDVDVATVRPEGAALDTLIQSEGLETMLSPGPFWEHIDFHHDDPLLSQRWVREAITRAIDREEILDRTLRQTDPDAVALGNSLWMGNSVWYQPHLDVGYNPVVAERILVDNGCTRGEDDVYRCQGRRMSFVWASTNDDPARAEVFSVAAEDLAAIGVELVGDFRAPSTLVSRDFLFGGPDIWQLINFSWRARSDPLGAEPTYHCDGELNVNRYCSRDVEFWMGSAAKEIDPEQRAVMYNQADSLYLDDLALVPLYQRPTLMAWEGSTVSGPTPNYSWSTDLWNIAAWSGEGTIVIAIPEEPIELNPAQRGDDNADMVMAALFYGAFGVDPKHRVVPVLVDSVDVLEGQG